jgi:hypothetical protein
MDRLQPQDTLQLILKVVSRDTLLQVCLTIVRRGGKIWQLVYRQR